MENQIEKKIKVQRTDNGGEFCSKEFEEFCKKCGISRQRTTPYTPQQNGVVERMNKTLMERARSMLSCAGLGQELWAEAVDTACYLVNRFMSKPGKEHWTAVKRVFKYLRGTSDYGLCYQGRSGLDRILDIYGFVDADWAGDLDQRRSTSGYVFNIFGATVSWMSKKQFVMALSTTKAEYMATTHASKEAVWLQRLC
eukprot:PITA_16451